MLPAQKPAAAPATPIQSAPATPVKPVEPPQPVQAAPQLPQASPAPQPQAPGNFISDELQRLARDEHERDLKAIAVEMAHRSLYGIPNKGSRGDVLLRDEERRNRDQAKIDHAQGKIPEPPFDAGAAAREAMEREAHKAAADAARRQIDPAYNLKRTAEEEVKAKREAERTQNAPEAPRDAAWAMQRAQEKMQRDAEAAAVEKARRVADPAYNLKRVNEEQIEAQRQAEKVKRAAERAEGKPIKAEIVKDKGWALEEAKKSMEREHERRMLEQARVQIDPAYGKKKDDEEARRRQQDADRERNQSMQRASLGAMALGQAGMPGLARIPAGYGTGMQMQAAASQAGIGNSGSSLAGVVSSLPIAGAVVGAVKYVMDKIQEGITGAFKVGAAMISFDPDRFARGMADLVSKVPLVGGLMGGLAHGILDLSDAIVGTARHLAQYSGQLATQLARFEVIQIRRDINRAQTMGPQIFAAMEARQRFQDKLNEFMDRYTPVFLKAAEALLSMVSGIMDLPQNIARFFASTLASILEGINAMIPGDLLGAAVRALQQIAQNTTPAPQGNALDSLINLAEMTASPNMQTTVAPQASGSFFPNLQNFGG